MGMFDYINCKYSLPNQKYIDEWVTDPFQTKCLNNALDEFIISEDGNLILDDELENHKGWIDFYKFVYLDQKLNKNHGNLKEIGVNYQIHFVFNAEFFRGKLMSIKDESYVYIIEFDPSKDDKFKSSDKIHFRDFIKIVGEKDE